MKKFLFLLFIGALFVFSPNKVNAQVHINVNVNAMPQWGPVGFDRVEYYYLPEVGIYYYVPKAQFVYMQGGRWRFSSRLPNQYRNLDLYSTYKVVINRPRPYINHSYYVSHYKGYRNYHSRQGTIRDNRGKNNGNRENAGNRVKNNSGNNHGNKMENMQHNGNMQSSSHGKENQGGQMRNMKQDKNMKSAPGGKGNQGNQKERGNKEQGNR